jgi:hypothetical protein
MTAHTANYSFPYPELTDTPDGATETQNLAVAVDAALATEASTRTTATGRAALLATLMGSAVMRYTTLSGTINSLSSSSYGALLDSSSNSCGHSFVAPPSGIVVIKWGLNVSSGTTSSTVFVGTAVKTGGTVGAGTLVSDVTDDEAFTCADTQRYPGQRERPVTGLTPGSTYNVRISWRNSGVTTSTANKPWIITEPKLA